MPTPKRMPLPPPPPRPKDRRKHPRYSLFASVRVATAEDTFVLAARDLSLGGVYLEARPPVVAQFPLGSRHDLLIFDAIDPDRPPVRVAGDVKRQESDGFALAWVDPSPDTLRKLGRLLSTLKPRV